MGKPDKTFNSDITPRSLDYTYDWKHKMNFKIQDFKIGALKWYFHWIPLAHIR